MGGDIYDHKTWNMIGNNNNINNRVYSAYEGSSKFGKQ
jgi:hypothetical protein